MVFLPSHRTRQDFWPTGPYHGAMDPGRHTLGVACAMCVAYLPSRSAAIAETGARTPSGSLGCHTRRTS